MTMDPATLIPAADAIPVHWGWLKLLLLSTFLLHLLCMNTMLGIGIIALAQSVFTASRTGESNREIGSKLPYAIAFTVNMGVAPLLFIQALYGQFIYTSSIMMAVYWLSIIALLIIAYYSAYLYHYRFDAVGSARIVFMGLTVAILLIIGFFFSNNMTMMLSPEKWPRYFDAPNGLLLNLSEPTLAPRYLHVVLSAVAVGGLFLALVWEVKGRGGNSRHHRHIEQGLRWFAGATLLQFVVGSWWLASLPRHLTGLFMGGSSVATTSFALGLTGTILSLVFSFRNQTKPCVVSTVLTIACMVIMRDHLRTSSLEPYFTLSTLKVVPQYGSLVLFLVALGIGAVGVTYMLKLAFGKKPEAAS